MIAYGPKDGNEGWWDTKSTTAAMAACCSEGEIKSVLWPLSGCMETDRIPRLQKLSKLSIKPPVCVPVFEYPELEEWVHESGRLIVLGDAAHPMTVRDNSLPQRRHP